MHLEIIEKNVTGMGEGLLKPPPLTRRVRYLGVQKKLSLKRFVQEVKRNLRPKNIVSKKSFSPKRISSQTKYWVKK